MKHPNRAPGIEGLALLAALMIAAAPAGNFDSADDLNRWMGQYYQHRETERVMPAFRAMLRFGFLGKPTAWAPLIAFWGSVFYQHHKLLPRWLEQLRDLKGEEGRFLWEALSWSHNPQGIQVLEKTLARTTGEEREFIERLLREEKRPVLEMQIFDTAVLDMLWGQFLATGDERCVKRVISALSFMETAKDRDQFLIGGAARWSLISNAVQHPLVLETCKRAVASSPEEIRPTLTEVIHQAEEAIQRREETP
jgi:hypothetical protein